jgi:serine/threonine-protein kinase RsbW
VDEACNNIIEHGYAGRGDGTIQILCESDEESLRVTIVDHGRAFSPAKIAPADTTSGWRERPLGGLGWHLIRSSVDDVDYRPDPARGNRLTLVKRLTARRG